MITFQYLHVERKQEILKKLYQIEAEFAKFMLKKDWDTFYKAVCIDDKWDTVISFIKEYLDTHCPIRDIKDRDYKTQWMNVETLANY